MGKRQPPFGIASSYEVHIPLRVQAGAKTNEITGLVDGVLRVKVAAPAREGKANTAVVALLARVLGVPKSYIRIVRGHTSRDKVVAIEGTGDEEIRARLRAGLP